MREKNERSHIYRLWVCTVFVYSISYLAAGFAKAESVDNEIIDVNGFLRAYGTLEKAKILQLGDAVYGKLENKYRNDSGFGVFESKLKAAEYLAKKMETYLRKAAKTKILMVTDEMFVNDQVDLSEKAITVPPAKSFYETSLKLFARAVKAENLSKEEKEFLGIYYDLKLREFTKSIAEAGKALAVADPEFKGTYDYILVLALLHANKPRSINADILPGWCSKPEQLKELSDSCLLHYGQSYHAMMLAKIAAEREGKEFSEYEFYKAASGRCKAPHTAVDCLTRAMDYADANDSDSVVQLHFDIVEKWLDSGNYALAAGEAKRISDEYPGHEKYDRAVWLYYYSLSRDNNMNSILADIDEAISDSRVKSYGAELLYIKWWALRRKPDEQARAAAVEYELLKQYGDNPIAAPIMLSRCTDLLARQEYNNARIMMEDVIEKFPATESAKQAAKLMEKLKKLRDTN